MASSEARWPALLGLGALTLAVAGCAPSHSAPAPPAPPTAPTPAAGKTRHTLDLVGKVAGRGWYLPLYKRNPDDPNGPPMPVLIAHAETGEITKRKGNPEFVLHRVKARLFQKGALAARVVAGKIRTTQRDDKVFATGGCVITSLVNPADTVLSADRVTWDTKNTVFVAEGHAHAERRPKDHGLAIVQEGGRIIFDLAHNIVTVL